jgi:hypothetical protein
MQENMGSSPCGMGWGGAKLIHMKSVLNAQFAGTAGNINKTLYFLFQ